MTDVPVSPDVLSWARIYRGLSPTDAAALLGISEADLSAIEAGARKPSVTLFENIAAKYRLPQATLFRRTRPRVPPPPADYRTLGGKAHKESFEFNVALSNVRTLLHQFLKISEEDEEFVPPALPSYNLNDDPGELGERERARLGVGHHEQMGWRDSADAFRNWRRTIEAQGVSVFQQKYPLDDSRGFTIYEKTAAPAIVVNKSEAFDVAKIFTLIHEYGHLLIRRPGISDENPKNPVEAFCNKFAAGFLIPKSALRYLLPEWPNEPKEWSADQIRIWARKLKVSQQALALRLEHLGLAPNGFFARFSGGNIPKRTRVNQSGNYVLTRISEMGSNFAGTVLRALERGAIGKATAAEALGLSPDHFAKVRDSVSGRRSLADAEV